MKKITKKALALSVTAVFCIGQAAAQSPNDYRQRRYPVSTPAAVPTQLYQVSSVVITGNIPSPRVPDHQLIGSYEITPHSGSPLEPHFELRLLDEEGGYNSIVAPPVIAMHLLHLLWVTTQDHSA